jgi:hypothetical protein
MPNSVFLPQVIVEGKELLPGAEERRKPSLGSKGIGLPQQPASSQVHSLHGF